MTTTLRLRCIRCGDWAEMDHATVWGWGLCLGCLAKMMGALGDGSLRGVRRMNRFHERYQRNASRHPTHKALSAALDALEDTPPGTLAEEVVRCTYCENATPSRAVYGCDVCGADVCSDCSSGEDGAVVCDPDPALRPDVRCMAARS